MIKNKLVACINLMVLKCSTVIKHLKFKSKQSLVSVIQSHQTKDYKLFHIEASQKSVTGSEMRFFNRGLSSHWHLGPLVLMNTITLVVETVNGGACIC